jgi:glycosyltransferase involved in cell wall biosynthesis
MQMRMLQVAPSLNRLYGGPVYSVVAFARAARAAGVDVTIAGPKPPDKELEWAHAELPGMTIHTFPTVGADAFILSLPLVTWLTRHASEFDVIHVHGLLNPVSSLSALVAVRKKVPLVLHPFGTLSQYTFKHRRRWLKRAYFRLLDGPNLREAGAVHFTTATERDESLLHRLEWGGRAHVIPPPWIGDNVPSAPRMRDRPAVNVLIIARLHPVKNIEGLLDAWTTVVRRIPDARLTIAGDGKPDYIRELRARVARLGIKDSVKFTGFVRAAEKAQLLAAADLFVLPSYHENFGVVVLEALAAGIPVVLTPEVQISSFVVEHGLGRVAKRTPDAIADTIIEALGDTDLRVRCRDVAPSLLTEHFAPQKVGVMLRNMYEYAINQTRSRARS